jgi:hypothetical protein
MLLLPTGIPEPTSMKNGIGDTLPRDSTSKSSDPSPPKTLERDGLPGQWRRLGVALEGAATPPPTGTSLLANPAGGVSTRLAIVSLGDLGGSNMTPPSKFIIDLSILRDGPEGCSSGPPGWMLVGASVDPNLFMVA